MLAEARRGLDTGQGELDCIALGSPHFSAAEARALHRLAAGRRFAVPVYVCTGRGVLDELDVDGTRAALEMAGVTFITDTCVVVTPILQGHGRGGVMMTNSAKFAHYAPSNTGYHTCFGSLSDCVASAVAGRTVRDEALWQ
jgi:predicted aconitase